ncbi:hypothetical protein [Nostoc sp.]|uniref:hypothetical protein n=1 Tax=Nostoc sp. TaxID=1180 RepID=UPI003593DB14
MRYPEPCRDVAVLRLYIHFRRCLDAAIAYTLEAAKLRTPKLITVGASIGTTESAHAAAIRATFKALGVNIEIVPAAFVSMDNRNTWVLKV